jgi:hypothetical protein
VYVFTYVKSNSIFLGEIFLVPRDQCYDFNNMFAETLSKIFGVFTHNTASLCKLLIISRKSPIFSPIIDENRLKHYNIDPRPVKWAHFPGDSESKFL